MKYYEFPCGCRFPIIKEFADPELLPILDFDVDHIPDNCLATWAMVGEGKTQGCFQLESKLGMQWSKKLKPEHIEHLGALGALLRPGCLRAVDDKGVSMTQHYCRRKNMEEPIESYHPAVDAILGKTYNVMTYQEQAMAIATAVAGFSLVDADTLRKAIGKKLPEEMAKCKVMFLEGAKKAGILTDAQAIEVFDWIEKSQRYSFNKSHAISYGITGYQTAYVKFHFPVAFYTSWLAFAKEKQKPHEEVYNLVNDAKLFNVAVMAPDIRSLQSDFHTDGKIVRFGLSNIKGVGKAQVEKLKLAVEKATTILKKPIDEWTWFEFLVHCASSISSNIMSSLIKVGALSWMGVTRNQMLFDYTSWNGLTEKEQEWIQIRCGMKPPPKPEKPPKPAPDPNAPPKVKKPRKKKEAPTQQERTLSEEQASRMANDIANAEEVGCVVDDAQHAACDLLHEGYTYDEIDSMLNKYRRLKSDILIHEEQTAGPATDEEYAEVERLEEILYGLI